MTKCTPGPWRFDEATGCIFAGAGVPTRPVGYAAAGRPEAIANGYVMAAAPEMLTALRRAETDIGASITVIEDVTGEQAFGARQTLGIVRDAIANASPSPRCPSAVATGARAEAQGSPS